MTAHHGRKFCEDESLQTQGCTRKVYHEKDVTKTYSRNVVLDGYGKILRGHTRFGAHMLAVVRTF